MRKTNTPAIPWDHCFQRMAEIHTHTALDLFPLQGNSPFTYLTGKTPDMSHLVEFSWFDFIWYSNLGQEGR